MTAKLHLEASAYARFAYGILKAFVNRYRSKDLFARCQEKSHFKRFATT